MLVDGYFCSSERTAEENVWETVRQTDRQTDRQALIKWIETQT